MIETIKSRLHSLGYEADNNDIFALKFLLKETESHIKNFCNIKVLPVELEQMVVNKVSGNFLAQKKASGQLTSGQMEAVVKKIQDGDTTVEMARSVDSETIFSNYINDLTHGHDDCLIKYRKLCW